MNKTFHAVLTDLYNMTMSWRCVSSSTCSKGVERSGEIALVEVILLLANYLTIVWSVVCMSFVTLLKIFMNLQFIWWVCLLSLIHI